MSTAQVLDFQAAIPPSPEKREYPHNLEAEQAVLAGVLCSHVNFDDVAYLSPGDFYSPQNSVLWRVFQGMHKKGVAIDQVTVCEALKSAGKLEEAGGAVYIAELSEAVVIGARADWYADIVHKHSQRRKLIDTATAAAAEAFSPGSDVQAIWDKLRGEAGTNATNGKQGLVLLSSDELVAMDITPSEHILYPAIPENGLSMLFAPRGVGKTYLAMSIANAVAGGGDLFSGKDGPTWFARKARRVLYIDGEMPLYAIKERQDKIERGLSFHVPSGNLQYINPEMQRDYIMPKLATKSGQSQLDTVLDGFELVVIDNITTLCSTGRENYIDSWLPMQEWILGLRRRGISVLLVHHSGKSGDQLGTSAKEIVLNTVIKLSRPDNYTPEEDGARFIVEFTKNREVFGRDTLSFDAAVVVDGDRLTWTTKSLEHDKLMAVVELQQKGKTVRATADELGINRGSVNYYIKKAKKKGML